jgi:L-fuconate dehydratase
MIDANQKWGTARQAIDWVRELAPFKPVWIEEPTSPDDILAHAMIAKELNPLGIGVATGEQCQNRVVFKQLLQAKALQFCQIDATRLGGVNEVISVILMAHKFKVPVCPHAGGVGLCEYIQHLAIWDFVAVSGSLDNKMAEYVDHLSQHFESPSSMKGGSYVVPLESGYCCRIKPESRAHFRFPNGTYWNTTRGRTQSSI